MQSRFRLITAVWLLTLFFAVFSRFAFANPLKLEVFTSILPQKYFIEKIAGDLVNVEVLVGPGMSPHTFEPLPQQMGRLSRAAIFFTVGMSFEQVLVERLVDLCPNLTIIDTAAKVAKRPISEDDASHQHSEECSHETGTLDPHVWLDPTLVIIQAEAIAAALLELLPDNSQQIVDGLQKLTTELRELDEQLSASLARLKGETMLVFHPAFGYFAARYGLKQKAVELEGKEPGPRQLAELIRHCRRENVHLVFVQKQFPVAAAEAVARAINGTVVEIDPLAEDYVVNLRRLSELLLAGAK